jgi:outer membrane protein assembly factor BamE (lipoprotein component of BamABCDE complex)
MTAAVFKVVIALSGAALLAGCSSMGVRDHRGAVIDKELASAIQVGVDNKDSVSKTLGRPSFTGEFAPNDWYYVARDTRTVAFRAPKVLDQTVLHIRFDAAGNVSRIDHTGKELIASIDPVSGRTPTLGRKRGFFDELFGNIGTISQPGLPGSNRGGGPSQ